jgi:hypothetical protein
MNDQPIPHVIATPTAWKLLKSTLLAVVAAAVLLVTSVLPAEYGIDVTGIGRVLGLTQMGESKQRAYTQTLSAVSEILDRAAERQAIFSMQKKLEAMERDLAVIKSMVGQNKSAAPQP